MIQKQTNHLINEINKTKVYDDKLIGCAAIILVGLCYKFDKNHLTNALNILKKYLEFLLIIQDFLKLEISNN